MLMSALSDSPRLLSSQAKKVKEEDLWKILLKSEGIETIKECARASRWAASVLQEGCDHTGFFRNVSGKIKLVVPV